MWPVSAGFQAAVCTSHRRTARAVMRDPNGTSLLTLYPMGGEVSVDSRRDVRRTCTDLVLSNAPGDDLIPSSSTSTLSPLTDNEVALFRGVVLPDGTTEEAPLGVFGFQNVEVEDNGDGVTVTLSDLADRSRIVTRSRWRAPFVVIAGTLLSEAIRNGLTVCWPAVPNLTYSADATVGALVVFTEGADSDPWKDLCSLASAHGCELFFDAAGVPTIRALPTPSVSATALTYSDGPLSPITKIKRSLSIATGSYNGVIVSAESTSAATPYRGEWWDNDDPNTAPTRPRPLFFASPMIATADQAQATAQALLPKYLGATEILTWSQIPNPAIDVWDLIHVVHPAVKGDTYALVDSVTHPLAAAAEATVVGRSRQVWA